jgi:hypothetical protein
LSGALALGKRGVTCIPRQPLSFAPSSTSLCFLRALSGSTGWQWPVSWSTLGSLQLVGCVSGAKEVYAEDTHRTVRHETWNSAVSRLLPGPGLSRIFFHVSSS